MRERAPLRAALGVGLVAGCTLALQVLLTRVLSAVLAYHFSFLAISLALLGVGAGGLVVYLRQGWADGPVEPRLARWSVALAVLLVVMPLALVRLDYSSGLGTGVTRDFALTLAAICVLAAVPFCVAGVVIALAVRGYARWIGTVYAFDLAGAAIGALVVVPLLWLVSGTTLLVVAGGARRDRRAAVRRRPDRDRGALALAVVAVAFAATTSLYALPPHITASDAEPLVTRWTPLSRVLGYPPPAGTKFAPLFYDRVYAPVPVRAPGRAAARLAHAQARPAERRLRARGAGADARDRRRRRARHRERAQLRAAAGRRDRAQPGDPRRRRRGPRALVRLAVLAAGRGGRDRRRALPARRPRHPLRRDPHRLHRHAERQLGRGLRAHRGEPLHAGGVRRVLRPPGAGRDPQRLPPPPARRRRGAAGDRAGARRARRRGHRASRSATSSCCSATTSSTSCSAPCSCAASRGRTPSSTASARSRASAATASRSPPAARTSSSGRTSQPLRATREFCGSYRLDVCPPTDDRPFFFNMTRLGDLAAKPPPGYFFTTDPVRVLALTLAILLVLCAAAFGLPLAARADARPPAAALDGLLRGDRARLPGAGDRADPAVRAVPRLPDLRVVGRAVLAAAVDRARLAACPRACAIRAARCSPRSRSRARCSRPRRSPSSRCCAR